MAGWSRCCRCWRPDASSRWTHTCGLSCGRSHACIRRRGGTGLKSAGQTSFTLLLFLFSGWIKSYWWSAGCAAEGRSHSLLKLGLLIVDDGTVSQWQLVRRTSSRLHNLEEERRMMRPLRRRRARGCWVKARVIRCRRDINKNSRGPRVEPWGTPQEICDIQIRYFQWTAFNQCLRLV